MTDRTLLTHRRIHTKIVEEMKLSNFADELKVILTERNSEGENFFHEVSRSGSFSLIERFAPFIRGFDAAEALNTRNSAGQMSIHIVAITHEKLYAAKLIDTIVKLGADINGQEGIGGNTALHLAVNKRDYELVEWLCRQPDIDLKLYNSNNVSPFQSAKKMKDKKMVQILKKYCSNRKIFFFLNYGT